MEGSKPIKKYLTTLFVPGVETPPSKAVIADEVVVTGGSVIFYLGGDVVLIAPSQYLTVVKAME